MTIRHSLTAAAGRYSPPTPTDPQFNYVSMLLHGDGTNGAQNNTFVDSSSNNFTITRNGNTTQGSLSPYGNLWSNFFDGSGDYLNTPSNAAFSFGTGDFTVELWAYCTQDLTNGSTQFSLYASESINSSGSFGLFFLGGTWYVRINGLGNDLTAAASASQRNTWVHFAVCRNAGTMTFYINGASVASGNRSTQSVTQTQAYLGFLNGFTGYDFAGYMSNVRAVKGTAVYTSAFTPPTAPLTAISGTSLLTCQSNRFRDASANNFTITRTGDVRVTKEAPFLPIAAYSTSVIGGSGYFDGAGDWLQIANNTALQVGSNDFCIECWICPTAMPAAGTVARFMTKNTGQPTGYEWTFGITPSGQLQFVFYTINTVAVTSSSGLIAANSCWYHVAFCRSGTTFGLFCNGVRQGGTVASRAILSTTSPVAIGRDLETTGREFTGYICDARIVNGSSVYDPSSGATLTVPTAPLTAITNTSLLLNFTNAGIFDNAAENDLETVGNAQISTSVKKYGTGSLAFDGTGDWLLAPNNPNIQLGDGTFTIECWVYPTTSGSAMAIAGKAETTTTGWEIGINSSNLFFFFDRTSITYSGSVPLNTWTHVAVVRTPVSNGTKLYLNGVSSSSTTSTTNFNDSGLLYVGAGRTGRLPFTGYIDDFRITKGVARYTANFTPPTAAFPDQ